ncbi:hypothetical protein V3I01_09725 [Sphingomonas sp. gentR]|uniref:hypothetical protein n=1 Tax=Sphingomonas sp. gentR TaxID=3118768 RepID=UPI0030CE6859
MEETRTDMGGALNGTLAVGISALAGVAELVAALRPTIGDEAADKVTNIMVERLREIGPIPALAESVEQEIRDRAQSR